MGNADEVTLSISSLFILKIRNEFSSLQIDCSIQEIYDEASFFRCDLNLTLPYVILTT